MIQLLRVDHRLLHGQVVFSWCSQLNPNLHPDRKRCCRYR